MYMLFSSSFHVSKCYVVALGADTQCNRLFPKVCNPHGNVCATILNGAMISSIVW